LPGVRAHPGKRGRRGFLHHGPELTRDRQATLPRVGCRLEEEDVTARGGKRETGRHAWIGRTLAHLALEASRAEPGPHTALVDTQRLGADPTLCDPAGRLAQEVGESTLEIADPGLTRVLADDQAQRAVGDADLLGAESVSLELLRYEVALGDSELLVLRVTGELDHVHAVEQRRRDRFEGVRRSDEQHLGQ